MHWIRYAKSCAGRADFFMSGNARPFKIVIKVRM